MPVDISEYDRLARDNLNDSIPTGNEPGLVTQQLTPGGASVQSAEFAENARFIRVHTDVAVRFAFGKNPTASASSPRLGPGSTEFFGVRPGHKMAVITTS